MSKREIKYNKKENIFEGRYVEYQAIVTPDLKHGFIYDNSRNTIDLVAKRDEHRVLMTKKPYYRSSGWGNSSQGDYQLTKAHGAIRCLFETMGFAVTCAPSVDLFDETVMRKADKTIEKYRAYAKISGLGTDNVNYDLEACQKALARLRAKPSKKPAQNIVETMQRLEKRVVAWLAGKGRVGKLLDYQFTSDKILSGSILLAQRLADGTILMNSQSFQNNKVSSYFVPKKANGQNLVQYMLTETKLCNALPFNVFNAANLKLADTKLVDKTSPESVKLTKGSRHFTGALLLENQGSFYLFDLDRGELPKIWNPFLSKIAMPCKTIAEAYESFKPESVKLAEKEGKKVLRQGEWFFIETDQEVTEERQKFSAYGDQGPRFNTWDQVTTWNTQLRHGQSRPNNVLSPPSLRERGLVCGVVTHSGREHSPLNLGYESKIEQDQVNSGSPAKQVYSFKLWQAVPNTATSNFTITGDVD